MHNENINYLRDGSRKSNNKTRRKSNKSNKDTVGTLKYRRKRGFLSRTGITAGVAALFVFITTLIILTVYFIINSEPRSPVDTSDTTNVDTSGMSDSNNEDNGSSGGENNGDETQDIKDKYEIISVDNSTVNKGYLILVNPWHEYVFDNDENIVSLYRNKDKSPHYGLATAAISCDAYVFSRLNEFVDAYYEATGDDGTIINSGHRTYEEQEDILTSRIEKVGEEEAYKYVAIPGYSEHHTGYALDIVSHQNSKGSQWYVDNCWLYGFIHRYPEDKQDITGIYYEYWHFRYVGVPHAEIMMSNGIVLEEYINMLYSYSYDSPLVFETQDGVTYQIYYAACNGEPTDGGKTDIYVPVGVEYDISGNNVDGFIITTVIDGGANTAQ